MANDTSTQNKAPLKRRGADAPVPREPMPRGAKPEKSAAKPLHAFITQETDLTEKQKLPLTAREKPKPAKADFPPPLPSKHIISERPAPMQAHAENLTENPLPRHTVTAEELQSHRAPLPQKR